MLSNNNNNFSTTSSSTPSLAKQEELRQFESSFFPAGGAPHLTNIPQAPPAPKNLGNLRTRQIPLKTRNWGPKLENGFSGVNRSLYDRPNVFSWDKSPVLSERSHFLDHPSPSFPSSSTTSTSSSSSPLQSGWNIPTAPQGPQWNTRAWNNNGMLRGGRRLRLRDWGMMSPDGWSNFNRQLYLNGLQLERNVILNELWAKYQPRANLLDDVNSRGLVAENLTVLPTTSISTMNTMNTMNTMMTTVATPSFVQAPVEVRATTVPVPMLNPPLNDGRRYEKLYNMNTQALGSGKGVTSLIKPRGTRRDHLVQPATFIPPTSSTTGPGAGQLTKKQLRQQRKLAKKQSGLTPSFNPILPTAAQNTLLPQQQLGGLGGVSPLTTTGAPGVPLAAPALGTVKHAKLGSAPLKRPRRARKAKKGGEQPLFSNVVSATQAAPIYAGNQLQSIAVPSATTASVLPVQSVSTTFVKEERVIPLVQPLAIGNPIM